MRRRCVRDWRLQAAIRAGCHRMRHGSLGAANNMGAICCGVGAWGLHITGVHRMRRGAWRLENIIGKNSKEIAVCTHEICRAGGLETHFIGGGSKHDVKWVPPIKCDVEACRHDITRVKKTRVITTFRSLTL